MKKLAVIFVTLSMLCVCTGALASGAPYMVAGVLDWTGTVYDIIEGQFKCVDLEDGTYYAMHNWYDERQDGAGYAGFQYKDGETWTIMSIWHTPTSRASIEYAPEGAVAEPFDGEGEGMHVLVRYPWEPGIWYTMRIEAVTRGQKTFYTQWVKPEGGDWTKTAVISCNQPNNGFMWDCFFLEDWVGNGGLRSCQLRGYYARRASDRRWESLRTYHVYCSDEKAIYYSFAQTDSSTVFIQSGGNRFPAQELPGTLSVLQPTEPDWWYNLER